MKDFLQVEFLADRSGVIMMNSKWNAAIASSALLAAMALTAALASAQTPAAPANDAPAKPSPYVGVSQPPPDDSIVSNPDAPPPTAQTAPTAQPVQTVPPVEPAPNAPALVTRPVNPDATIVTHPVDANTYPSAGAYSTRARSSNPDADIVTFVPTRPGELPQGTNIHIRLLQQLSSTDTKRGASFTGQVSKDVTLGGSVIIPQGSELRGRVESVREGHRFGNRATIRLRPETIVLPDGSQYALRASVVGVHGRNARVDGEGAIAPKRHVEKAAVEEGIGAGAGAVAGGMIAGPPGAFVGSLVGVGVVTTHLLIQRPQAVDLPGSTTIVFSLTEPLALTPVQN